MLENLLKLLEGFGIKKIGFKLKFYFPTFYKVKKTKENKKMKKKCPGSKIRSKGKGKGLGVGKGKGPIGRPKK